MATTVVGEVPERYEPSAELPPGPVRSRLDRFFGITRSGSTISTEIRAGGATFLTMCYILAVNPSILSSVKDHAGHTLAFTQVMTVTALVAGVMSIAMGVISNKPLALAAGLGLNAFVAYSLVGGAAHLSWPDAMGVIVVEGALIAILSYVKNVRARVLNAIPMSLKKSIGAGIGLFIALIGLVNAGVVVKGNGTLVALAPHFRGWALLIFAVGLVVTAAFKALNVRGSLLYGIVFTTVFATVVNALNNNRVFTDGSARIPHSFPLPDFGLVGAFSFNFWNVLGASSAIAIVLSVMMSDFFDNAGTGYGILARAGMLKEDGTMPRERSFFVLDGLAALFGGVCSQSSGTTFIESSAGVEEGGRTGLTAVVVGILFLACLFLSPIAGMVPSVATAPILVIVGYLMIQLVRDIEWENPRIGIPALLTIIMMPATYSITNGIGAGIVSYAAISLLTGHGRKVHPFIYVVAAIFGWYFWHGIIG